MKILFAFILTYSLHAHTQIAHVSVNWDGELEIRLEPEFLKEKKVAQITFEYSSKKPNQIIRPSSDEKIEKFDFQGRLIEQKSIKHIGSAKIEKHQIYDYKLDILHQLIERDETGYFCSYFEHINDTLVSKVYRAIHYDPISSSSKLDSTLINIKYRLTSKLFERVYNKNRVHVQSKKTTFSDLGLLESENIKYELSGYQLQKRYNYNEEGLNSEIELESNHLSKKFHLFYDRNDILQKVEVWKENRKTQINELVYNEAGWLDALIIQNPETNHIKITKYRYNIHP